MKHNWILDEFGKPDEWAWESVFHNGVICRDCGFRPCIHCDTDWFEMDDCRGPLVRKVRTNADKIREMDDETLAAQLVQVFCEGVMALVDMEVPESLKDQAMADILEKLKQPEVETDA